MELQGQVLLKCQALVDRLKLGAASAQSADELLTAKGCLGCHDRDTQKVGPAFKDVAAKYKGDKNADRKSTRLNSSHIQKSRMPSSA